MFNVKLHGILGVGEGLIYKYISFPKLLMISDFHYFFKDVFFTAIYLNIYILHQQICFHFLFKIRKEKKTRIPVVV